MEVPIITVELSSTDVAATTKEERDCIREISFSSELGFSMPVDLSLSKKAFQCILSGLSEEVPSFDSLFEPRPHKPCRDYCPMGQMDLSFLQKT